MLLNIKTIIKNIGIKLLILLSPLFFHYLLMFFAPQYGDQILQSFFKIKHYHQYNNSQNLQKIANIKLLTNEYIDEITLQFKSLGYEPPFRPNVYVVVTSHTFEKDYNAIASCSFESGNIVIYVNDDFESNFFKVRNYFGKMVVLHELGHCWFKLKHTEETPNIMAAKIEDSAKESLNYHLQTYLNNVNYNKSWNANQEIKIPNITLYGMINSSKNNEKVVSYWDIKTYAFVNLFDYYPLLGDINNAIAKKTSPTTIRQ